MYLRSALLQAVARFCRNLFSFSSFSLLFIHPQDCECASWLECSWVRLPLRSLSIDTLVPSTNGKYTSFGTGTKEVKTPDMEKTFFMLSAYRRTNHAFLQQNTARSMRAVLLMNTSPIDYACSRAPNLSVLSSRAQIPAVFFIFHSSSLPLPLPCNLHRISPLHCLGASCSIHHGQPLQLTNPYSALPSTYHIHQPACFHSLSLVLFLDLFFFTSHMRTTLRRYLHPVRPLRQNHEVGNQLDRSPRCNWCLQPVRV